MINDPSKRDREILGGGPVRAVCHLHCGSNQIRQCRSQDSLEGLPKPQGGGQGIFTDKSCDSFV